MLHGAFDRNKRIDFRSQEEALFHRLLSVVVCLLGRDQTELRTECPTRL